jgi:signal transduction histidine kinase
VRLLRLQDEERRKFSRELHDSLGQYLVGVKMNLDMLANTLPGDELLSGAIQLLDQSIAETRTISHLLHPPLLDEAGFASAAR